ncbi:MAG TPA: IclR family transcriptional regulator [Acidimicrobiales bacterium]|nr:IclR family transcriptional regulator [Acidimicrobiales bacterium]
MTATRPPRNSLSSASNALLVLEYLVEVDEAGVSDISRHLGVTVATAHRLVATLVATGFAEQNAANRRYRPSHKLVVLAQRSRQTVDAREMAHACLANLAQVVHETCNLAILSSSTVLYTDKVTSDQPFGIEARVGSCLPAYCTALGKVLLAGLPDEALADYLSYMKAARKRRELPPPPADALFKAEIRSAREKGYAIDEGEYLPDVFCAAAPISGSDGSVIAAMSIATPRSRFHAKKRTFIQEVCNSAQALSKEFVDLGLPRQPQELAPAGIFARNALD